MAVLNLVYSRLTMYASLRNRLSELGAGRLLYRWGYRPYQNWGLARAYGWSLLRRAKSGEEQMRKAARRLPPLNADDATPRTNPICFLTGERFLHQTIFCAHSFATATGTTGPFEFISDGTLTTKHAEILHRVFPSSVVRLHDAIDLTVNKTLPPARFPILNQLRHKFVLLRKLTDSMAGQSGFRLLLDSDMLFWRKPTQLLENSAAGSAFYMRDMVDDGYTMPAQELSQILVAPVASGVNSGLVGLNASLINWTLLEKACAFLLASSGDKRLLEQTLWAIALGAQSGTVINAASYRLLVYPNDLDARAIAESTLLHYAWHSRLPYFAGEWQRYLMTIHSNGA